MARTLWIFGFLASLAALASPDAARSQPDFSRLPCRDASLKPNEYIDQHLVYFDLDSAELPVTRWARIVLESAACWAKLGPAVVRIVANADTSGSADYNLYRNGAAGPWRTLWCGWACPGPRSRWRPSESAGPPCRRVTTHLSRSTAMCSSMCDRPPEREGPNPPRPSRWS